jgi:hypothetical protein
VAPRRSLIASDDLGKEGICYLGNDEAKKIAASGRQAPGMRVLIVVEFANHLKHTTAGFFGNIFAVVEHA